MLTRFFLKIFVRKKPDNFDRFLTIAFAVYHSEPGIVSNGAKGNYEKIVKNRLSPMHVVENICINRSMIFGDLVEFKACIQLISSSTLKRTIK